MRGGRDLERRIIKLEGHRRVGGTSVDDPVGGGVDVEHVGEDDCLQRIYGEGGSAAGRAAGQVGDDGGVIAGLVRLRSGHVKGGVGRIGNYDVVEEPLILQRRVSRSRRQEADVAASI